jgi:hypothetical protein
MARRTLPDPQGPGAPRGGGPLVRQRATRSSRDERHLERPRSPGRPAPRRCFAAPPPYRRSARRRARERARTRPAAARDPTRKKKLPHARPPRAPGIVPRARTRGSMGASPGGSECRIDASWSRGIRLRGGVHGSRYKPRFARHRISKLATLQMNDLLASPGSSCAATRLHNPTAPRWKRSPKRAYPLSR